MERVSLITTLQPYSSVVEDEVRKLQVYWPDEVTLTLDNDISVFSAYPLLFLDAFPSLTPEAIRPLAVAGRLIATMVAVSDSLIDGKSPSDQTPAMLFRIQTLQHESDRQLQHLFPPHSSFWSHWRAYLAEYMQACLVERHFAYGARSWSAYTDVVAYPVAIGKSALTKVIIAGLVTLSNDQHMMQSLIASVEHYCIARQLFDDLEDWKDDLRFRQPSLLLAQVCDPWQESDQAMAFDERLSSLGRRLYYEGHVSALLERALIELDHADQAIIDLPPMLWHDLMADLRGKCESLSHDITQIIQANIRRVQQAREQALTPIETQ